MSITFSTFNLIPKTENIVFDYQNKSFVISKIIDSLENVPSKYWKYLFEVNNITLDISSGKFVGIAGQSGSGKSTLMKLLPRLYELDRGKILIDDYDIKKVELYSLRRQVGIVPQDPLLFAGTVSENISIKEIDYYFSNSIARSSKTMSDCRAARSKKIINKTGS